MTQHTQTPEFLKPEPKRPAEPVRRQAPSITTWAEYEAARTRATNEPGPDGEADRQAALAFAVDRLPSDIASTYYAEISRGRR